MIEFEIPFVCLIFTILVSTVFFLKKKVDIKENYYYKNILIFTLLVNISNFISHYMASILAKESITASFAKIFSNMNKLGSLFIIIITINLLSYVLYISFEKYRDNFHKFKIINIIFYFIIGVIVFLLDFEVYKVGGVTSGQGSSIIFTFALAFINLLIAFVIALFNLKKYDKRYFAIYFIIPLIFFLGIFVMFHPQFNIYDLILSLLCYLMYFTIENPDIKMISQLSLAKDTAEKANRAKSDFLSSMSHEIRTPLNAIVGLSQDIINYDIPPEALEDANDIINASNTLLEIVGNILDINKIESDKMVIVAQPYNFREEIESLIRVTSTRIGDKPINFSYHIAEDIPSELIGDKVHIKAIVNNLITNAIKYTDKGKIVVSIKCINEGDVSRLFISVQDTGRGIKAEDINKLFNKFERLDIEKNSTTEGTGLGLAITKRLVEMMNGKINVQSTYREGSLFVVSVPQKISRRENNLKMQEIKIEKLFIDLRKNYSGKKILIVDDNKLNIKVARKALADFDFFIDEAYDGEGCLQKINNGNIYDLILMDIMMPKMSGREVLQRLKNLDNFDVPVIALTADALSDSEKKYIEEGFVGYIAKPFNKEQIAEKLYKIFIN